LPRASGRRKERLKAGSGSGALGLSNEFTSTVAKKAAGLPWTRRPSLPMRQMVEWQAWGYWLIRSLRRRCDPTPATRYLLAWWVRKMVEGSAPTQRAGLIVCLDHRSRRAIVPPSGWAICDGTKGTSNVSDRFIIDGLRKAGGKLASAGHDHGVKTDPAESIPALVTLIYIMKL
jgi:hypothetical protein